MSLTESVLGGIFGGKITSTLLTREIGNGQDDRQLDMSLFSGISFHPGKKYKFESYQYILGI